MTTDFRALCADLLWALENAIRVIYHEDGTKHISTAKPIVNRARAALAKADEPAVPEGREPASVTGQPSDEEIMGLMPQQMHEDLAYAARAMANEAGTDNRKAKGFMRIALNRHAVDLARAVLAHWGNPAPAPPADGEVAGLVEMLKGIAYWRLHGTDKPTPFDIRQAARLTRAADLLQRQVLVPVPVSERLPGDQLCWWFEADEDCGYGSNWTLLRIRGSATGYTHWLPAHALPLPEVDE